MKKKALIGIAIGSTIVLLLAFYSYLGKDSIIGHNKIDRVIIEKYSIASKESVSLIDTIEILDQNRIANLVKALDKPKNQMLDTDLDMLVIYDRNYIVTIKYLNGSELKLAVTFGSIASKDTYAPSKIRIGESFFDDSNVFIMSKVDIDIFTKIID